MHSHKTTKKASVDDISVYLQSSAPENLFNPKRGKIACILSIFRHPDMTDILLKKMENRKSFVHLNLPINCMAKIGIAALCREEPVIQFKKID